MPQTIGFYGVGLPDGQLLDVPGLTEPKHIFANYDVEPQQWIALSYALCPAMRRNPHAWVRPDSWTINSTDSPLPDWCTSDLIEIYKSKFDRIREDWTIRRDRTLLDDGNWIIAPSVQIDTVVNARILYCAGHVGTIRQTHVGWIGAGSRIDLVSESVIELATEAMLGQVEYSILLQVEQGSIGYLRSSVIDLCLGTTIGKAEHAIIRE